MSALSSLLARQPGMWVIDQFPTWQSLNRDHSGALRRAQEAFYASLDPLTVADMVAPPTGPLLLGLPGARRPS